MKVSFSIGKGSRAALESSKGAGRSIKGVPGVRESTKEQKGNEMGSSARATRQYRRFKTPEYHENMSPHNTNRFFHVRFPIHLEQ